MAWATAELDTVRRGMWNQLRAAGRKDQANTLKDTRQALLKNPANQTTDQRTTGAPIAATNKPLYRACLLTKQLQMVFQTTGKPAHRLLAS
ncbi:MAG: transposase [Pseudonocardiaceae bacterium]